MAASQEQAARLVKGLGEAGIVLVQWDERLVMRFGVPLAGNGREFYLVPDEDLSFVRETAAGQGLSPVSDDALTGYHLPTTAVGFHVHYADNIGQIPCLAFIPLSWTGIRLDELVPLSEATFTPRTPSSAAQTGWVPPYIKTVSIASACAALIRIFATDPRNNNMYDLDLTSIVCYGLFDMSYEGDYMEIPGNDVPLSDKEKAEMAAAVADVRSWHFRDDEAWMQEYLIQFVSGKSPSLHQWVNGKARDRV